MSVFITLGDIISFALAAIFGLILLVIYFLIWWAQWRCKHDGDFGETQACDAICHQCGKNLGFIGTVRAKRAAAAIGKSERGE
jgi:hypothetical protein